MLAITAACAPYPGTVGPAPADARSIRWEAAATGLTVGFPDRRLAAGADTAVVVRLSGDALAKPIERRLEAASADGTGTRTWFESLPPGRLAVDVAVVDAACQVIAVAHGTVVVEDGRSGTVELLPAAPTAGAGFPVTCPSPPGSPVPTATPTPAGPAFGSVLASGPVGSLAEGIAVGSQVWVTNVGGDSVTRLSLDAVPLGTTAVGAAPRGVALDHAGNAWIAVSGDDDLVQLGPDGEELLRVAVDKAPWDVAIDDWGRIWVTHLDKKTVTVLYGSGEPFDVYRVEKEPSAIALGLDATMWVASAKRDLVTRLLPDGSFVGASAVGRYPVDVAIGPDGHAWVVTRGDDALTELDADGVALATYPTGQAPSGVAIDAQGRRWVTNQGDGTLRVFGPTGATTLPLGGAPTGIALDAAGHAWVVDTANAVVKRIAR